MFTDLTILLTDSSSCCSAPFSTTNKLTISLLFRNQMIFFWRCQSVLASVLNIYTQITFWFFKFENFITPPSQASCSFKCALKQWSGNYAKEKCQSEPSRIMRFSYPSNLCLYWKSYGCWQNYSHLNDNWNCVKTFIFSDRYSFKLGCK